VADLTPESTRDPIVEAWVFPGEERGLTDAEVGLWTLGDDGTFGMQGE
jgi:hypothetical protein